MTFPRFSLSLICGLMILYSNSYAADDAVIRAQENKIIAQFKDRDFYEINHDVMQKVLSLLTFKNSYQYDFKKLKENFYFQTLEAPDHRFKIYTFDVGGGGTMGEYQSYVQFKNNPQHYAELELGWVNKIDQISLNKDPVYLIRSYYKGSSCVGMFDLKAFKQRNNKLLEAPVFYTKKQVLSNISVEYDCHHDQDGENTYINLSPDLKQIDVQFLNAEYKPQNKTIRYVLNKDGYYYQGNFPKK